MGLTAQLDLQDQDLKGLHDDNTIQITISGANADNAPLTEIKDVIINAAKQANITITAQDLPSYYRLEEGRKVFLPLPSTLPRHRIHGISIQRDSTTYTATIPGKDITKIFLSYVPPTLTDTGIQKSKTSSHHQTDSYNSSRTSTTDWTDIFSSSTQK